MLGQWHPWSGSATGWGTVSGRPAGNRAGCLHVRVDEVAHVDVVALRRAVGGRKRGAHDCKLRPETEGDVVRRVDDARILLVGVVPKVRPDPPCRIGADHIEVAQKSRREGCSRTLLRLQESDDGMLRLELCQRSLHRLLACMCQPMTSFFAALQATAATVPPP